MHWLYSKDNLSSWWKAKWLLLHVTYTYILATILTFVAYHIFSGDAEVAQAKLKGLENETCSIQPNPRLRGNNNIANLGNNLAATPNNQQTKVLVGGQLTADQLKFNPLKEQMDARNRMPSTDIEKVEESKYKLLQAQTTPQTNKQHLVVDESQFRYIHEKLLFFLLFLYFFCGVWVSLLLLVVGKLNTDCSMCDIPARSINLTRFTFLDPGSLFLQNKSYWIHKRTIKICSSFVLRRYSISYTNRQCPQIEWHYRIKNKAAIALQCKLNGKLIAALLFIPYSSLIWGYSLKVNIIWEISNQMPPFTVLLSRLRYANLISAIFFFWKQ